MSRWGWGPIAQLPGGKSFRTRAGVSRGVCTACFFFLPTFLPFWFAFPSPVPTTRPLALSLGLSPGGRTRAGCPLRVPTPVGDVGSTPQSTPRSHNPLQIPARDAQPKKKRVGKLAQHPGAHPRCLGHPKDPSSRVAMPHVHLAIHSPHFQGAEGAAPHISPPCPLTSPLAQGRGPRDPGSAPGAAVPCEGSDPETKPSPCTPETPPAPFRSPCAPPTDPPRLLGAVLGHPKTPPPAPSRPHTGRTGKFLVPGTRKSSVLGHRFPPQPYPNPSHWGGRGGSTHPCSPPAEPPHCPPSSV